MAASTSVSEMSVEGYVFPAVVKAPGSDKSFILAGAGVRGLEIPGGRIIKITSIGVYLEETVVPVLTGKWKGKTTDEVASSEEFFCDVISGTFEKFIQVTMLVPLTGKEYSEKVAAKCLETWKAVGIYTDEEGKAIDSFVDTFKDVNFAPGHSILYTQSSNGSLTIGFSKHETIPETGIAVIENKILSASILESLVGKYGVAPEVKLSLATRLPQLLNN